MPLGCSVTVYDEQSVGGGMMLSQIRSFRLPESVLNEEVNYILNMGVDTRFGQRVDSLADIINEDYDAIFIGTGAPKGRDLKLPGRNHAANSIHIGVEWLASVAFDHTTDIGGEQVTVTVRSPFTTINDTFR